MELKKEKLTKLKVSRSKEIIQIEEKINETDIRTTGKNKQTQNLAL